MGVAVAHLCTVAGVSIVAVFVLASYGPAGPDPWGILAGAIVAGKFLLTGRGVRHVLCGR
jgi:hypothetical protein